MLSRRRVTCLAVFALALGLRAAPSAATAVWGVQPVESSGYDQGHNTTAIALNAQGNPRIAFYEGSGRDLYFAEKSAGVWTVLVVDTTGNTGRWVSLAIDSQGNPHISYTYFLDPTDLPVLDLKYATRSGGIWTITTVDATGDVGEYTSLVLDSQGNPHISYYDNENGNLKYARKSGGSCMHTQHRSSTFCCVTFLPLPSSIGPYLLHSSGCTLVQQLRTGEASASWYPR